MSAADRPFDWHASLSTTYSEIAQSVVAYAPRVVGALLLLLIGWLVAKLVAAAVGKLFVGLNRLLRRFERRDGRSLVQPLRASHGIAITQVVFWVVMLFFFAASSNVLGWNLFAGWIAGILGYLPKLITGLLILLAGYLLSNVLRAATVTAAASAGIGEPELPARVVQAIALFTAAVIAVEQFGVNVQFLTTMLAVAGGVLLSGGTFAFAFGARNLVANIIGAQQLRRHCRVGEFVRVGAIKGILVEITQTTLVIETKEGRATVPAKLFHEQICRFVANPHRIREEISRDDRDDDEPDGDGEMSPDGRGGAA